MYVLAVCFVYRFREMVQFRVVLSILDGCWFQISGFLIDCSWWDICICMYSLLRVCVLILDFALKRFRTVCGFWVLGGLI